jgi:hypothetical protein
VHLVVVNFYLAGRSRHIHAVIPLHGHKTPAQIFYFVFNRAVGVPSQKPIMGTDGLHCAAAAPRVCSINHAAGSFAFIKYLIAPCAIDVPQAMNAVVFQVGICSLFYRAAEFHLVHIEPDEEVVHPPRAGKTQRRAG